jgi:hypothetical protein
VFGEVKMSEDIWSIEEAQNDCIHTPLPTNAQLLQTLYFFHNVQGVSTKTACTKVANKLVLELERMGFRPMTRNSIRVKIVRLLDEYLKLRKNHKSNEQWQINRIESFRSKLNLTFTGYIEFCEQPKSSKEAPKGKDLFEMGLDSLTHLILLQLQQSHWFPIKNPSALASNEK